MKVIKRNGSEVDFDITKIIAAVTKANDVVEESERMTPMQIRRIAESVDLACQKMNRSPSVEEIQDLVEKQIMAHGAFEVAKRYITYRYTRSLVRRSNTTDEKILSLIECCNEEAKQENSNKNPVVIPPSATIWQARSRGISPTVSCCPPILWRRTMRALSTSTTATTLRSICITAIWSIWRICCRTAP